MNIGHIMIAAGIFIFCIITWHMIQKVHLEVLNLKSFICDEVLKYIESEIKRLEEVLMMHEHVKPEELYKKTLNELREEAGIDPISKVINGTHYTAEEWCKQFNNIFTETQKQDVLDNLCIHYTGACNLDGKCDGVGFRGKLKEECLECDLFVGANNKPEDPVKFCGKEKHPYA